MEQPSVYFKYFRFLLFLAHALTAAFFLGKAFDSTCANVVSASYFHTYRPSPTVWPVSHPSAPCPRAPTNVTVFGFPSAQWGNLWCEAMQIPAAWDQLQDMRSFTIGASWNIIVLITVFEWITASYALLYTEEPAPLWALIPTPPGLVAQPFLATVWNLTLLVVLWACRYSVRCPDNNLFLYTALIIAVILKQNYIARTPDPPAAQPRPALPEPSAPLITQWRTDHFIRQRRGKRSPEEEFLLGANADVAFHWPQYVQLLDLSGKAVIARLMEYTSTAPLLMVGTLLMGDSTAETWLYQIVLLSMVGCNSVAPIIHYGLCLQKHAENKGKLRLAGALAFLACWVMFFAAFFAYVYNARLWLLQAPSATGIPDWVLGLLWLVILGYFGFGAAMTWFYFPLYYYNNTDSLLDASATLVWVFDILSLTVKLSVAWTIYMKGGVVNCIAPTVPTCP